MKLKIFLFSLSSSILCAQVPSTWSASSTYTSGALVLDSSGVTYIAQQDVNTAGTALSNTSYWLSLDAAAPTQAPSTSAQHLPRTLLLYLLHRRIQQEILETQTVVL